MFITKNYYNFNNARTPGIEPGLTDLEFARVPTSDACVK